MSIFSNLTKVEQMSRNVNCSSKKYKNYGVKILKTEVQSFRYDSNRRNFHGF